jgi:Bifunctional DNA primase/polymerase, N-terminal
VERITVVNEQCRSALGYAARWGPVVFPCVPGGKEPAGWLVPHGLKDATGDFDVIEAWWAAEPEANIGLRTGITFDALDVDGPDALDALERAGAIGDPDIEGPTVATPRGWHVYVAPTGRGNTVNQGGLTGVDWRGANGYVIAPPSRKDDGTCWEWIIGLTGDPIDRGPSTPITEAPQWVLDLFDRPAEACDHGRHDRPSRHAGRTGYGAAALEREVGRLAMAPVGERNHTLNAAAFSLGQLAIEGCLDVDQIGDTLYDVALRIGLRSDEAEKTIRSGLIAGQRTPRKPSTRRKIP